MYERKIIEDLRDYELRSGYDYLKDFFPFAIKNILIRLERNNFRNYDDALKKGKKELDEIFNMYFNFLSQFKEISDFLSAQSLDDPTIIKISSQYKEALDGFNNHIALCDTEKRLKKILSMIDEYKKEKEKQKKLSEIGDYIKTIVANYNNAIHKFTYPDELSKAEAATDMLNVVFKMARSVEKGIIPLKLFSLLINLKFDSYDDDIRILELFKHYIQRKSYGKQNFDYIFPYFESYANPEEKKINDEFTMHENNKRH